MIFNNVREFWDAVKNKQIEFISDYTYADNGQLAIGTGWYRWDDGTIHNEREPDEVERYR